jgi:hypothetical protein
LGCILYIGGKPYIISNSHVLADCGKARIGDDTLQPGTYDGGDEFQDAIGALAFFTPFKTEAPNTIDFAMSEADPALVSDHIVQLAPYPKIIDVAPVEAELGMVAVKSGRTTGLTVGKVTGTDVTIEVGGFPQGTLQFEDLIMIEGPDPLCKGGDSGSAVFTPNGGLLGLLFAGPGEPPFDLYFACKIQNILTALNGGTGSMQFAALESQDISFRPATYGAATIGDTKWAVPLIGSIFTASVIIGLSKVLKGR